MSYADWGWCVDYLIRFQGNSVKTAYLWPFVLLDILTLSARFLKENLCLSFEILYADWA